MFFYFKPLFLVKISFICNIAFLCEKVVSYESGEKYASIKVNKSFF